MGHNKHIRLMLEHTANRIDADLPLFSDFFWSPEAFADWLFHVVPYSRLTMRLRATIIRACRLGVNMTKNSSTPLKRQNLASIPDRRAKKFLEELASMSDERLHDSEHKAVDAFEERYGDIIPYKWLFSTSRKSIEEAAPGSLLRLIDPRNLIYSTPSLRDALRAIWIAPDKRTKEWGVFRLIESAVISDTNPTPHSASTTFQIVDGHVLPLPPPTSLEYCLRYLLRNGNRAVVCANAECPAQYFFAGRRSQKYCSEECAQPAQRKFKREWWAKNGEKWRARHR
jgi:hypothetical protein